MSPFRSIFNRKGHGPDNELDGSNDLERGQELLPITPRPAYHQPAQGAHGSDYILPATRYVPPLKYQRHVESSEPRTSNADSEFSQPQSPVSPDRYEKALLSIEGKHPSGTASLSGVDTSDDEPEMANIPAEDSSQMAPITTSDSTDVSQAQLGPGGSQTTSSMSAPQLAATQSQLSQTADILGSNETDWQTLSEAKSGALAENAASSAQTGDSLANTSDSGRLSGARYGSIEAKRVVHHAGIPRHHQAFVFVKDGQTGNTLGVPQQINAAYRHPVPLAERHRNPFASSPPMLHSRESRETVQTESFDELVKIYGSSQTDSDQDMARNIEAANREEEARQRTPTSSGWMDTLSEGESGGSPPLPMRSGSFAKVTVLGAKGNLTGTLDGTGAREAGSSLAGASSPPSVTNSRSASLSKTSTHHLEHRHLNATPIRSPNFASVNQSLDSGLLQRTRRRRSSSESSCKVTASPLAVKASAIQSPNFRGHMKRNTMDGLLVPGAFVPYHDDDTPQIDFNESNLRERRGHAEEQQRDDSSVSTESRPFVREGVIHTNVPPPVFNHPVYGIQQRPSNRAPPLNRGRPQARSDRYQRPIARVESPHLYRIPRPPTAEAVRRQHELSRFWLLIFCIIPPVALIYGHGYADEIISIQTGGEIERFTDGSKKAALYWGYAGTPTMIFLLVIVAIVAGHA